MINSDSLPMPKFLVRFSMRGFFAFLGALLAEENGAGATFFLGACIALAWNSNWDMREEIPFGASCRWM